MKKTVGVFGRNILNNSPARTLLMAAADMLFAGLIFFAVSYVFRLCSAEPYRISRYWNFLPFLLVYVTINTAMKCYHGSFFYPGIGLNKIEELRRLFYSAVLTYLLLYSFLMFSRFNLKYSRVILCTSLLLTVIAMPLLRALFRRLMLNWNIGQINVVIYGTSDLAQELAKELYRNAFYGFKVTGFIADSSDHPGEIGGLPVLGEVGAASRLAREYRIGYCICCQSVEKSILAYPQLSKSFSNITYVPAVKMLPAGLSPASIGLFGGFELQNRLAMKLPRLMKMGLEMLFCIIAVVLGLPVLLVLALLVKLTSPGPVLYSARRLGRGGRPIRVWKFRTMYLDAENRLEELLENNPVLKREWEKNFKLADDPRITKLGKFLRRTSLDELPQLFNVLNGTMSLIGPRPIVEAEIRYYGNTYEFRKRVKPGLTGLWQVSGRSQTSYRRRVMLDAYYVMNWSIWLDYYIFFKTVWMVLSREGAR